MLSLDDFKAISDMYKKDQAQRINLLLFESSKKFYEQRLETKILLPKIKKVNTNIVNKFLKTIYISNTTFFNQNYKTDMIKDFDDISYFSNFITTDTLDDAITEIPIETQLFKEDNCEELENLNSNMLNLLKDLRKDGDSLQEELPKKEALVRDLEEKIKKQEEIKLEIERLSSEILEKQITQELLSTFTDSRKQKKD
jgi:hypothetical protein